MSRIDPDAERPVRRFLASISGRFDVAGAVVCGSRARGTPRPDSDADRTVVLRGKPVRWLAAKLETADAAFDVLLDTGILVSLLPVSVEGRVSKEIGRGCGTPRQRDQGRARAQ